MIIVQNGKVEQTKNIFTHKKFTRNTKLQNESKNKKRNVYVTDHLRVKKSFLMILWFVFLQLAFLIIFYNLEVFFIYFL